MSNLYQGMRAVEMKDLLEEERRKLDAGFVSSDHAMALAVAIKSLVNLVKLDMK